MQSTIAQVFTRVFVKADEVDETSAFYRALLGGHEAQRFADEKTELLIAAATSPKLSVLIIGGSEESRKHFASTNLTIAVGSLAEIVVFLS